jgi:hypothetical protein
MVMIYLKVFSWWRRVKAGRRASRQHETPLSQLDQPRFDPPIYASHPDPNEYVVLVFVDGVRDLPKSAQIKLLVAECGEDSTETQLSKECSANIILHAATTASDLTVGILGSNDSDVFSARIAMPLPSAPEDFSYRAEWHSSDIGSGQLRASVLKLKFRDLARVTSSFSKSRAPGDDSSQLEQMVEKLQSVLASTNNESFQELGLNSSGSFSRRAETLLGFLVDQTHQDRRSLSSAEARMAQLERENAALQDENRSLQKLRSGDSAAALQSDDIQAAMLVTESRMSDNRAAFEKKIREQQNTIDALLKKEQDMSDTLKVAHTDLASMRELTGGTGDEKDNKIYELNRQITIANDLNKEHASALSIAAKKLVRLQDTLEVYRHTMRDVSRALGSTMNSLVTSPLSREELESMHSSALDTTPDAPDAVLALRVSERIGMLITRLDQEIQLALTDVSPSTRNLLKQIPVFEDGLVRHTKSISNINSETNRLMAAVEDACGGFEMELLAIQQEEL